ncbi:MAG TPA: alpha/beta fold hydrolase, partial [Acidimicrobiia bacterium]
MRRATIVTLCLAVAASGCSGAGRVRSANSSAATTTTTSPPTTSSSAPAPPPRQPVVLLHGTFGMTSWGVIEGALSAAGYAVYPFDYGNAGTDEIGRSAGTLAGFVDDVLLRSGAKRVSIIGHSQGGLVARYYVKYLGGSEHVDDLIGLSPSNHGTTNPLVVQTGLIGCAACAEQQADSPFLANLNAGDETPPPVDYTVIQTRRDEVVIPYTS